MAQLGGCLGRRPLDLRVPPGRADERVENRELLQEPVRSRPVEGAKLVRVRLDGLAGDPELVRRGRVGRGIRRLVVDRHELERGEGGLDVVLQRREALGGRRLAAPSDQDDDDDHRHHQDRACGEPEAAAPRACFPVERHLARDDGDGGAALALERAGRGGGDVLGTSRVGEIEDAGAVDERDARQERGDAEVARGRLHLVQELLDELRAGRGEDAARVLREGDRAKAVDGRDAAGPVLGIDPVEARLGDQLERIGLEPERIGCRLEPRLRAGRLAIGRADLERDGAGGDGPEDVVTGVEGGLDRDGRGRGARGDAGGSASRASSTAAPSLVALRVSLRADERDGGTDRREDLGMLGRE